MRTVYRFANRDIAIAFATSKAKKPGDWYVIQSRDFFYVENEVPMVRSWETLVWSSVPGLVPTESIT